MIEYNVTKVAIQTAGTGYAVNDVLTADLDLEDAKFKVTAVKPLKYTVTAATASGTMSGYETDETITVKGAEGDTSAVLTITAEDGAITALTVTAGGSFASDISGSVSSDDIVYEGEGTGLELSVTASGNADVGAITAITIKEGGESSTGTISNPVSVTGGTGSGAKLTLTLSLPFEEVEVADVPGVMPKPATEVSYVDYDVSSVDVPIDYNTTFTREYPVA